MRVVVTGASGNVGTSLLARLERDPEVRSVVGIARRIGKVMPFPDVSWRGLDIASADLDREFEGADAVVHLAWAIQPSHDDARLWRTNILGSRRVFESAGRAGVPTLLYASSIGAYAPGSKEMPVDEGWAIGGTPTSFYSRDKAAVEWILDEAEKRYPDMRVVRMRPALIFKRNAASGIHRLFFPRWLPRATLRHGALPLLPMPATLNFQAVHTDDVATAFHLALHSSRAGAFNLHSEPMLDTAAVADVLGTDLRHLPFPLLRGAVAASWRARLQPTPEGWLDMAVDVPRMSSARAHRDLRWQPEHDAGQALGELFAGLAEGASFPTPALARTGLAARVATRPSSRARPR